MPSINYFIVTLTKNGKICKVFHFDKYASIHSLVSIFGAENFGARFEGKCNIEAVRGEIKFSVPLTSFRGEIKFSVPLTSFEVESLDHLISVATSFKNKELRR